MSVNSFIVYSDDNCPQTAHPISVSLSAFVSLQKSLIIVSIKDSEGGSGGNLAVESESINPSFLVLT